MQKLAREYLDELNKRHKKNRRALVAWILMAVLVVGGVMGTLAQYGVAFEGNADCGLEEHTHGDECYTETRELTCDLAEGEEHTHGDGCYKVTEKLTCGLEEHTHGDSCRSAQPEAGDPAEPEKTAPSEGNGTSDVPETPPAVTDKDTDTENPQNPPADTEDEANPEDPENPPADPDDGVDTEDVQNPATGTENGVKEDPVDGDSTETGTVSGNDVTTFSPPFKGDYEDDQVIIHVTADEGVIPKGTELKVEPIAKRDLEELESRKDVTAEEIEKAREINEKYDEVYQALEKTIPEDEIKKIAGFTAYDISFLVADEEGEITEFEPQEEVSVEMNFTQAFLPESVTDNEGIEITDVNLVHMRETGKELKAETMEDAAIDLSEDSEVKNVAFTSSDFSIYTVAWTRGPLKLEYEDGNTIISVEENEIGNIPEGAVLNVVPVVEGNEETEEQYKNIETKLEEKAEEDSYKIAGFMAYDLSLTAQNDAVVELGGDVKVSIEYKKAVVPNAIVPELTDVSMMMLNLDEEEKTEQTKETEKSKIQARARMAAPAAVSASETEIVDLSTENKVTTLEITENKEIQKAEFVTGRLKTAAVAWNQTNIDFLEIVDEIEEKGCLTVELYQTNALWNYDSSNPNPEGIDLIEGENFTYKWYKDINNAHGSDIDKWPEVQRKEYENGCFNVAEDGSWLNVAYDRGALNSEQTSVRYAVKVYYEERPVAYTYFIPKYSRPNLNYSWTDKWFSILYWDELQNGGFETPEVPQGKLHDFFDVYGVGMVWKTTRDQPIEVGVCREENNELNIDYMYSWYGEKTPPDGKQFAELNGHADGALYQDVITIRDKELNYWLSHRARGYVQNNIAEYDTMYVVIAPTYIAKTAGTDGGEIDTQEEVEMLMKNKDQYPGVYVKSYTSDDQLWHDYEEIDAYTPTSYLTRFFFVSGKTATNNNTMGNFLDRVGFSQSLPPAKPKTFGLKITKKVQGLTLEGLDLSDKIVIDEKTGTESFIKLTEDEISERIKEKIDGQLKNLQFEISAKNGDGEVDQNAPHVGELPITADGWKWRKEGDSYIGVYEYKNIPIDDEQSYTYMVTEKNENVDSYTCEPELNIIGGEIKYDANEKPVSTILKEKDIGRFEFTNTYTSGVPDTTNLQIKKEWIDSDNKYKVRPNSIQVYVETTDVDGKWAAYVTKGHQDGIYTLDSSNQWETQIEVVKGSQYRISEKNVDAHYIVSYTDSNPAIVTATDTSVSVTITNTLKWQMVKRSSSNVDQLLSGAKFELKDKESGKCVATFTSGEKGVIEIDADEKLQVPLNGIYTMSEIEAPANYMLSEATWEVEVENNKLAGISGDVNSVKWADNNGTITVYIENALLYELPSTGGSGIYRYMISGVLLMMAGTLILYNNKRARRCAGV